MGTYLYIAPVSMRKDLMLSVVNISLQQGSWLILVYMDWIYWCSVTKGSPSWSGPQIGDSLGPWVHGSQLHRARVLFSKCVWVHSPPAFLCSESDSSVQAREESSTQNLLCILNIFRDVNLSLCACFWDGTGQLQNLCSFRVKGELPLNLSRWHSFKILVVIFAYFYIKTL